MQKQMIPIVIEESGRGERAFDIYARLLRERIIFLGEAVTSDSANRRIPESWKKTGRNFDGHFYT